MPHRAITTLQQTLRPHVDLGKSRLETLCLIVVGMVSARTVNLSHLACERPTTALVASTYRRLQRFFRATFASAPTGRRRWWWGSSGSRVRGISRSTAPSGSSARVTSTS
jgi:hypothetical protein